MVGLPSIEATLSTQADLAKSYVASQFYGLIPALQSLPHAFDDLTEEFGVDVYERMMKDSEIAANVGLLVMSSTSQTARFTPSLQPNNPEFAKSLFVSKFFQWMFDNLEENFWENRRALVREGLTFGSGIGELTYKIVTTGPYSGYYALQGIRPLCIKDTAFVVDNFNRTVGLIPTKLPIMKLPVGSMIPLTTSTDGSGKFQINDQLVDSIVPRSKFWVLTWDPRRGDPRGRSILRPSYLPWWVKQQTVSELMAWLAKYAQPSLWGTTAPNAATVCITDPETGAVTEIKPTQVLLESMMKFRGASAIALPHGAELNVLNVSSSGEIFLKVLAWANREITRGILMQHMATSDSEHMARSAAETHQDVLSLLIVNLRTWQAESLRTDIVGPLTVANFGEKYAHLAPKLDLGDGDGFPITPMEVAQLQYASWFTPDQMAVLDRLLGLPVREVSVNPMTSWDASNGIDTTQPSNNLNPAVDGQQHQGSGTPAASDAGANRSIRSAVSETNPFISSIGA